MPLSQDAADRVAKTLAFNDAGLIPAIAQQHDTGEILMMAWMNADAVKETLTTDRVTYYSRSRQQLWRKGETSGHTQALKDFRYDCDQDTVLVMVDQTGNACHTDRPNCFYYSAREADDVELTQPGDPHPGLA